MSTRLLLGLTALIGCAAAAAQAPARPSGTIAGMVVDGGNNSPIRRAVVTLATVETRPQEAVAWTDAGGHFAFGYLPAGRYELRVSKFGYQAIVYGADSPRRPPGIIQLAAGELRTDLVFRLQLVTAITGSVLDEQGEPVPNVLVSAMRWGWQRQKRRLLPGPGATSDSSGHYRITGMPAGSYAVAASPMGRAAVAQVHPETAVGEQQQSQLSFGLQYYPGTDRAESATLIPVEPGNEYSQIDFHLVARPNPVIQGKIVPPAGIEKLEQANIFVRGDDPGNRTNMGMGVNQSDLSFRFDGFQPGSYTLVGQGTAAGKQYRGVQTVELGAGGISGLEIPLQASVDLAGTVLVEGPDAAKHPASFVSLTAGDGIPLPVNGPQLRATINKDGSFKISNVPPGIWDIGAGPVPPGGYIKSMHLGDQDVLTEEMVIGPSTQAPLKIVIGTQAATVQGDVGSNGQPARALVLLAPESRFRHVMSFYRTAAADANGHFEIKGATPGDYQLFAFDELDQQSIQDPEFLKPFQTAGVAVTLREGENAAQKLTLISTTNHPGGVQ